MERSPSLAWRSVCLVIAVGFLLGCGRKGPDVADGPPPGPPKVEQANDAPSSGIVLRPEETSAESPAVMSSAPAEPPLYRGSVTGELADNPLREESPPLSLAPAVVATENPLREAHAFRARP